VPTLLHAVGLKPPAGMQGVNLLDAEAVARRRAIFGECFTHDAVDIDDPASSLRYRWVLAGDWRLIVPHPANVPEGEIELYNLAADPTEEKNLARQQPGQVETLHQQLDAWWSPAKQRTPK
jgi:uncharacterized sulfatase